MAEIKTLKQGNNQIAPKTVADAVSTTSGSTVQAELDALKSNVPDVSAQISEHNQSEEAHPYLQNAISQINTSLGEATTNFSGHMSNTNNPHSVTAAQTGALPLTGGTMTGTIVLAGNPTDINDAVNKQYVDTQIAAIPTPDVSAQINAHNTSEDAHANMHWLTAEDELLSSIDPDGSIDADTLEGHPASYFATKSDLESVDVDLSDYYTSAQVDTKLNDYVTNSSLSTTLSSYALASALESLTSRVTAIETEINGVAAKIDEINGEVI